MTSSDASKSYLALDVGDSRIGMARAGAIARLPEPLKALPNDDSFVDSLKALIEAEDVGLIIIGLPRNLSGEETNQSQKIRKFSDKLSDIGVDIEFVDESLSSVRADEFLNSSRLKYDQDSVAACYILQEFLDKNGVKNEI